MLELP